MGVPIALELHHVNGNHYDNRLENLLVLCPNCHALTDSHTNIDQLNALVENQKELAPKIQEALLVTKEQKEKEFKIKSEEKVKQLEKESKKINKESNSEKDKEPRICPVCGEKFYPKHKI